MATRVPASMRSHAATCCVTWNVGGLIPKLMESRWTQTVDWLVVDAAFVLWSLSLTLAKLSSPLTYSLARVYAMAFLLQRLDDHKLMIELGLVPSMMAVLKWVETKKAGNMTLKQSVSNRADLKISWKNAWDESVDVVWVHQPSEFLWICDQSVDPSIFPSGLMERLLEAKARELLEGLPLVGTSCDFFPANLQWKFSEFFLAPETNLGQSFFVHLGSILSFQFWNQN